MKSTKQENMMDKMDDDLEMAERFAIDMLYTMDMWGMDVEGVILQGYRKKKMQHHMQDLI